MDKPEENAYEGYNHNGFDYTTPTAFYNKRITVMMEF